MDEQLSRKREELRNMIRDARELQDRLHSMLPRRQTKSVEELKRDISLGSETSYTTEEDGPASAGRRDALDRLNDFISKLKKE